MSDREISDFVRDFHTDLTGWFTGRGERDATWQRLTKRCPTSMTLVYPSGTEMNGAEFLASIEGRYGMSPRFEAKVERVRVMHDSPNTAAVAYVEVQRGAKASSRINRRSALALVERQCGEVRWRYIQETAIPADSEGRGGQDSSA